MSGKAARDGGAPRRHCQRKRFIRSPVGLRERSALLTVTPQSTWLGAVATEA